jgi:hypothetical protein
MRYQVQVRRGRNRDPRIGWKPLKKYSSFNTDAEAKRVLADEERYAIGDVEFRIVIMKSKKHRKKNPIRTSEGRVLRTEGHTRREASELLTLRKKEKSQHKRRTRRSGNLSYQSAEYVLRYGSGGSRAGSRGKSGRQIDVWDWIVGTF